jgi:hydrogenase maturation protein HypF
MSGGVFQNELLLRDLQSLLEPERLQIWTNHVVPPNDGGISLGQAALAALTIKPSRASQGKMDSVWVTHVT